MSKTFKVSGRILRWKLQVYENGVFVKETDHVYRFKFLAQADVDNFTRMERTREKEMNLDCGE